MSDNPTPAEFWEARYADADGLWSGRPNAVLVEVVADLPVGRALDLGCGEGGDSVWLAARGWAVTGVDLSPTAVRRAADAARAAGVPDDRAEFIAADLATWRGNGAYDLVTASFLHSPVEFPRTRVLRDAADLVASGGHLLLIGHAAFPPWATVPDRDAEDHGDHRFLSPQEEIDELALDPAAWDTVLAETRDRDAVGPDGTRAVLTDTIVLLRRN
ncbi:MAG: class I SAM-dependent methyltransferase [Rhodococcus sp.]|uniref:class I SAM-dependent methyltransferase n=1 Tax=Rhodococcus TaxID=1827 RepID=UPI001695299B|nr:MULTISPECIES: class I SAM-dependent methyltransferase [Rhodococcus]NLV78382.1 class I SAM-dependent methyltransferase [Rhodococcus sp. (in: high G+C Gram-positive bacteria)]